MDQYEIDKLLKQIAELQQELNASKKYGLVWDKEKVEESVVEECTTKIPVLLPQKKFNITGGKNNNVLIEGDNYYSLISLDTILEEKIDVIYIDPPYNTGHNDFIYNDKFVDEEDTFRHSKWLSFIQKRLVLAKRLLKADGFIAISIGDQELFALKMLCDSVFSENCFVSMLIRKTSSSPRMDAAFIANATDYCLVYAKNPKQLKISGSPSPTYDTADTQKLSKDEHFLERGYYILNKLDRGSISYSESCDYPISCSDGDIAYAGGTKDGWERRHSGVHGKKDWCWRWNKTKLDWGIKNDFIVFKKNKVYFKQYEKVDNSLNPIDREVRFSNLLIDPLFANENGKQSLIDIFKRGTFDYPKPVSLIEHIINLHPNKNAIIFDFFAGSGTTGQAVLELNKKDGGNRKFILCTNNENNICTDVTYPRLKTVITGIRPDGSKYSDGIPSNLYYFKTGFVEDLNNSDQTKYNLAEKVDSLLCIAEDIFDEKERNDYSSHFVSSDKKRHLFIYNDYFNKKKFDEFKERVIKADGEKVVYVFSFDNNLDESLFDDKSINVKPIPEKIYEIYKEIAESIKRGE